MASTISYEAPNVIRKEFVMPESCGHGSMCYFDLLKSDVIDGRNLIQVKMPVGAKPFATSRVIISEENLNFGMPHRMKYTFLKNEKAVLLLDTSEIYGRLLDNFYSSLVKKMSCKGLDLGFLKFEQTDSFIVELDIDSAHEFSESIRFSFEQNASLDIIPYYNLLRFYEVNPSSALSVRSSLFDDAYSLSHSLRAGASVIPAVGETGYKNAVPYSSSFSCSPCGFSDFTVFVNDDSENIGYFATRKKVYNKDTFAHHQEIVEKNKQRILHLLRTDYAQTVYKILLGQLPKVDDLNALLDKYAEVQFNAGGFGHFDDYEYTELLKNDV